MRTMIALVASVLVVVMMVCSVGAAAVNVNSTYSLNAFSNYPYRRIGLEGQRDTLLAACAVLKQFTPDMMIMDCQDDQLFATDNLVVAGLLLANSTDPVQQTQGYALLDSVYGYVYGSTEPMLPLNDVWGYDDPVTGRSYALVGASNGVHIVDVTVPISPVSILFVPGAYSLWRDIKIYNRTMYAVNDNNWGSLLTRFPNVNQSYIDPWVQDDGLVIIDLSYALQPHFVKKTNEFFQCAHNIQTEHDFNSSDTTAVCSWCRPYAYVVGQQVAGMSRGDVARRGGFIVLDITNNQYPVQAGVWNETYIHDIVIQHRDGKWIGFAAAIYSIAGETPGLYIIDVTDPKNPTTLYSYITHYNLTHNAWPTDDGQYLYVTHEIVDSPITIWSIGNLSDVHQVGELFIAPGNIDIVAHNVHVRGNYLWVSYYSQGSVVYDITDRVHPVLVGQYDTSPDIPFGMDGTWGIYPYANSHYAYATDMSNGLFVLDLQQQPATGIQGERGEKGEKGDQGPKGDNGAEGAAGPAGAVGAEGPVGPAGPGTSEHVTTFIVISSILHGISIVAITVLLLMVRKAGSYQRL